MKTHADPFRILIIDDTPTIHDDFRKILTPLTQTNPQVDTLAAAIFGQADPTPVPVRFELESAVQGQTGLALAQDALAEGRPFALAFVDMRMPPGWDGLETIRRLWAVDPQLQVVICTAYSDHSWSAITERLGQSDNLLILKKPFDNVEVLQLAHALTRKWRLARDIEVHVSGLDDLLRARTEELRRAEEGFTTAFEASPLAQALVSLDNPKIIAINGAFEKTMALKKEDAIGLTPDSFGRGFDPTRWKNLLAHLADGGSVDDHACIYHPTPEITREIRCSARPLIIRGERHSIWVLRDVTEQIETERQLRQSQKMEAIGQLAAGVAHDFNNLLTVIQGYTSELLVQNNESKTRDMIEPVQAAATRAANLTRQLLIFSRKEVAQPQQLNLMVVFKELRPLLRRLIGTDIDVQWNVPEKLAPIMADPANFEQIVVNLVINARDAMPDGGRIEIAAKNSTLEAGSPALDPDARPGNYVEVSVIDNGTGIRPEILSRIFEPFFTTKEAGKGTGLGLSTVHSITRQQGGWIRVESEVGKGTKFTVYHPVIESPLGSNDRDSNVNDPARSGHDEYRNVLVVEDDPTLKSLLSNILKRHNIRHTLAADGVIAQEMWRTANPPFDLLVTDIVMPNGVNGIRLARTLRESNPDLGVVLTSGFSALLFDPANLQMPGNPPRILQKPFSPDDLLCAMTEACISPLA